MSKQLIKELIKEMIRDGEISIKVSSMEYHWDYESKELSLSDVKNTILECDFELEVGDGQTHKLC